ncbi:MAG TPA: hypothetical protein VLM11_03700 [Streptosporangiaceae bacterium]|nr:hypothetical protein [Streptosporangiaceae bacterium]
MSGTVARGGAAGQQQVADVAAQHTGPRRRHRRVAAGVTVLVALSAGAAGAWRAGVFSSAASATLGERGMPAPATAAVVRQDIAATTPVSATLGYAGSYTVAGQGGGTLTWLPRPGQVISQGQVLYRTGNGSPVVLLCGSVPAWRNLVEGLTGADVSQLNHDLVKLGYAHHAGIAAAGWDYFSWETADGIQRLEERLGVSFPPGSLSLGQVVFEPQAIRVTQLTGSLGGAAAGPVLAATSNRHVVTIALDVSQESEVRAGDAVAVTLPDGKTTPGVVSSVGTVATTTPGSQGQNPVTTIPVQVRLTDPVAAGSLDEAPVTVNITTATARDVLAVPVTALVARSPGEYVVEVVGAGSMRRYVPVKVGPVFDDADGLVQVSGPLTPGQRVVVAAS